MNILIAPDSFKGSLTATQFCQIVNQQIQKLNPDTRVYQMPLADGGEGTIEAILSNVPGKLIPETVKNPLGKNIVAHYAVLDHSNTAVIEMAQASGLPLLTTDEVNPMRATSYGTGQLIQAALNKGCQQFIIGLGGSATNDAGAGMLQALGAQFMNEQGQVIDICGGNLKEIAHIDLSLFDKRLKEVEITIAGDVTNPLLGQQGATYTFGPQKGADSRMLIELETGVNHFANKTYEHLGLDVTLSDASGAGAAGGMGYSLMAYASANMKSGFDLIAKLADFDKLIDSKETMPDLIITGEGCFDEQSLQGKLIGQLNQYSEQHQIPILVICGVIGEKLDISQFSQNMTIQSLCNDTITQEYAIKNSLSLLENLISSTLTSTLKLHLKQ